MSYRVTDKLIDDRQWTIHQTRQKHQNSSTIVSLEALGWDDILILQWACYRETLTLHITYNMALKGWHAPTTSHPQIIHVVEESTLQIQHTWGVCPPPHSSRRLKKKLPVNKCCLSGFQSNIQSTITHHFPYGLYCLFFLHHFPYSLLVL